MTSLVDKIVLIHEALQAEKFPHAFGGALALAWCTQQARGTIDIDVNIFVNPDQSESVLVRLPNEVTWSQDDLQRLIRDGQVRIWWQDTPLDIFLNTTPYHQQLWQRVRWELFAGKRIPFLACLDLAVFKAFFNRTKDWADLEAMQEAGTLEIETVKSVLTEYLGADDERIDSLSRLTVQ